MSKLIIRLDSALFSKGTVADLGTPASGAGAETDYITEVMKKYQNALSSALSEQIPVGFDDEVIKEIERGDSYRVHSALPKKITIKEFQAFLNAQQIVNESLQVLILHFLIQNRIGLFIAIGGCMDAILLDLANGQTKPPVSPLLLNTWSDKQQKRIEFGVDSFTINLKLPISETRDRERLPIADYVLRCCGLKKHKNDQRKIVGMAEAKIKIDYNPENPKNLEDLQIIVESFKLEFNQGHTLEQQLLLERIKLGLERYKDSQNLAIEQASSQVSRSKSQSNSAPKNKIKAWFSKYKWVVACISGAIIFGAIGAALCSTGFLSPLGLLAAGLGFKLGISGAALLAANIAISAGVGVLNGALVEGAISASQIVAAHTADILRQEEYYEEYIIRPADKSPAISPALSRFVQNREVVSEGRRPELSDSAEGYSTASTNDEETGKLEKPASNGQSLEQSDSEASFNDREERNAATDLVTPAHIIKNGIMP